MLINRIKKLVAKIEKGENLDREDALFITDINNDEILSLLWGADYLRRKFFKNKIVNCSIINAKCGACSEDCVFCAQSIKYQTNIESYPMLKKDILTESAIKSAEQGINNFGFVSSGKGLNDKDVDVVCETIKDLKDKKVNIDFCLSLGILSQNQFEKLKEAGAVRYHHNLETSRNNFEKICTTHSYDDRIQTINFAKDLGFQVCSGALFGLGEDWQDRIDLAFELKNLNVESIPLNFLNPILNTPAAGFDRLKPLDIIKIIALFRFVNPNKEIKIAGGREVNLRSLQPMIFYAGANGIMVGDYLVTKGRKIDDDLKMIEDLEMVLL